MYPGFLVNLPFLLNHLYMGTRVLFYPLYSIGDAVVLLAIHKRLENCESYHCCGSVPDYPIDAEKLVFSPLGETGKVLVLTIVLHGCCGVPGYPPETGNLLGLTIVLHGFCGVPGYPQRLGPISSHHSTPWVS